MRPSLTALVANGQVTRERAEPHRADLARRRAEGRFLAVVPGYTVVGDEPSTPEQ